MLPSVVPLDREAGSQGGDPGFGGDHRERPGGGLGHVHQQFALHEFEFAPGSVLAIVDGAAAAQRETAAIGQP